MRSGWGIASALGLAVASGLIAILCVRTTVGKILPADSPVLTRLAPHDPEFVLENATAALVRQRGILSAASLDAVRRGALAAPMDARPFLILGHQQLLEGQPQRALATLEAGQRLDPRQRVIHLLLLDRYLRTRRFAQAATQFSISARLVGTAGGAIATAMAQMSLAPATRDAVRQTLRTDPELEQSVLVALARSDTAPATIFALASPAALQNAGDTDRWGPVLISRLTERGRYLEARSVWQRIYHLASAQVAAPLYDAALQRLPGSPPFNWALTAGSLGAAEMRNHGLNIDYYGRESGELASQLLVLRPGPYQFAFSVEGPKVGTGAALSWLLQCATQSRSVLMRIPVTGAGISRRTGASFAVPPGCDAQRLVLTGEAGDFPVPINLTVRDLDLHAVSEGHP